MWGFVPVPCTIQRAGGGESPAEVRRAAFWTKWKWSQKPFLPSGVPTVSWTLVVFCVGNNWAGWGRLGAPSSGCRDVLCPHSSSIIPKFLQAAVLAQKSCSMEGSNLRNTPKGAPGFSSSHLLLGFPGVWQTLSPPGCGGSPRGAGVVVVGLGTGCEHQGCAQHPHSAGEFGGYGG